MHQKRNEDRRIQKTLGALRAALGALIREKDYDVITVAEILERANVGRSTFYMHFRDKDELLVSSMHDLLGSVSLQGAASVSGRQDRLLGFSLPVFEHIHRHRSQGAPGIGPRGRSIVHERLRQVIAGLVSDQLEAGSRRRGEGGRVPRRLLAQYVASTFILVLDWWVESGSTLRPDQADEVFRALVIPALTGGVAAGVGRAGFTCPREPVRRRLGR